jgi:hypothetical protein
MRVRAPVSYNDKDSMVPAWLKTIQPSVTDAPQELKSKKKKKVQGAKKAIEGSSDKENNTSHGGESGAVRPKGQSSAVEKKGTNAAKTMKKKSTVDNDKSPKAAATRGRNAGLTVVPIGALLTFFAVSGEPVYFQRRGWLSPIGIFDINK